MHTPDELIPLPGNKEVATALVQRLDLFLAEGGTIRQVCDETGVGRNWFSNIRKVAKGDVSAGINMSPVDDVRAFFEARGIGVNSVS
jgi:hypothetical protein